MLPPQEPAGSGLEGPAVTLPALVSAFFFNEKEIEAETSWNAFNPKFFVIGIESEGHGGCLFLCVFLFILIKRKERDHEAASWPPVNLSYRRCLDIISFFWTTPIKKRFTEGCG